VQISKDFTNGRGVDAILDMVGGDYIPRQLDLLAQEGRLCFVALMRGSKVETDFGLIQRKHLTVTGSTLRSRTVAHKGRNHHRADGQGVAALSRGRTAPVHLQAIPADRRRLGASPDGIDYLYWQNFCSSLEEEGMTVMRTT